MKALFFCQSSTPVDELIPALRLRWPDIMPLIANRGTTGVEIVRQQKLDLVFACEDTQDLNIWNIISNIRDFSDIPIVFVTNHSDEMAIIKGLELGADDYIGIPIKLMESVARISALMRRAGQPRGTSGEEQISLDDMRIDPNKFEVFLEQEKVALTDTEFRLLHLLVKNKHTALSREFIQSALWDDSVQKHSIKKYVQRLRQKLGDDAKNPTWIQTVRGVGYRINTVSPAMQDSVSFS